MKKFFIPIIADSVDPEVFWRLLVKEFKGLSNSRKIASLMYKEDDQERVSRVGEWEQHRGKKLLCVAILETAVGAVIVVADRHKLLQGFEVEPVGEPVLFT